MNYEALRRRQDTYVAKRTLEEAFGKGAKLDIEPDQPTNWQGYVVTLLIALFFIVAGALSQ